MCRVESLHFSQGVKPPAASPLTKAEINKFKRDGFLVMRQLVTGNELRDLQTAGDEIAHSFFWTDLVFRSFYQKIRMQTWRSKHAVAKFAFESTLPSIAAQLLGEQTSIRILKDAIFIQSPGKPGCGFHVDDKGFWPADDESGGINFWVALSHYTEAEGGGIRVARGSHTAKWAKECRDIIKVAAGEKPRTCNMDEWSPKCNEHLWKVSETHDVEPGDVILWDRWLFHKGETFRHNDTNTTVSKLRYTIRYIPSNAVAMGIHHGSVQDGEHYHGHHYPQVWPQVLESEIKKLSSVGWSIKDRLLPFF